MCAGIGLLGLGWVGMCMCWHTLGYASKGACMAWLELSEEEWRVLVLAGVVCCQ
jgi:hypothetical protein